MKIPDVITELDKIPASRSFFQKLQEDFMDLKLNNTFEVSQAPTNPVLVLMLMTGTGYRELLSESERGQLSRMLDNARTRWQTTNAVSPQTQYFTNTILQGAVEDQVPF